MGRAGYRHEEIKLSITPLIDVTFLLLIFFMCAMKFKTLDYKIQAWLPKKDGLIEDLRRPDEQRRIEVALRREAPDAPTRVSLFRVSLGTSDEGFRKLDEGVRRIFVRWSRDEIPPGDIDAGPEVPHQDVMRALDALVLAGVEQVYFRGTKRRLR